MSERVQHACWRRCAAATLLILAACAATRATALDPVSFDARFEMQARGFVIAEVRWHLARESDGFRFESHSEASGVAALLGGDRIDERSEWVAADGELRPVFYRYTRTGRRDRSVTVECDWPARSAQSVAAGARTRYPIAPGTVDALSYVLAMMHDLRAGVRKMRYDVASAGRVREFVLEAGAHERLETALGTLDTVRVSRVRDGGQRETVLWAAPALGFFPVRIDHRERDGERLSIRITALSR